MNYDNWKSTDPIMERAGACEEYLDNQIEAIDLIWRSWGLTPMVDTPDLGADEWRDQVHDYSIDGDRPTLLVAEILLETHLEQIEDPGPYVMTVRAYREMGPVLRKQWRVR